MNKNKLSRFLLSTSVGILSLGISEVSALSPSELVEYNAAINAQVDQVDTHRAAAISHYKVKNPKLSETELGDIADKLVYNPSGLSALNKLSGDTKQLFEHFNDILLGGVSLTPEHFDSFLSQITDVETLRELGVESIRELSSPEAERLATPSQITTVADAEYFAELRKDSGEFEAAAGFFLKARDLTESTNTTKRTEYAESALLMYSEHFIHHVARASNLTEANVTAAQTVLISVKALAETTNTAKAFLRAASCAEELGTAIYDLALMKAKARDLLTDATAITAENTKIAKTYVSLYSADIVARDMHEKVAALYSGNEKNLELAAAANAMRLAIGALSDAQLISSTAVFSGDVTVVTKLNDDAVAFKNMYQDLANTSGVTAPESLQTSAASAKILFAKLKATWNARDAFRADTGTASYIALNAQYTDISGRIVNELDSANTRYTDLSAGDKYLSARDIAVVRSVRAEMLYHEVKDAASVSAIVEADVTAAVDALSAYVTSSVKDVVAGLDDALKATLDEVKAAAIRRARADSNRTLAAAYALIAKATSTQLIKNTAAIVTDRATWLESYLTNARLANNKAAWEAGVEAADVVLAVATIATPTTDDACLVKALALTAKAEALLKRNTPESDTLVATVDSTNALTAGILFDAKAVADAMTQSDSSHVKATDNLRKAFESAVELHNSATVKQGLRNAWAAVEEAYAVGKLTIADTALTLNIQLGNGDFVTEILTQVGSAADRDAVKDALDTWIQANNLAGTALANGDIIPAGSYVTVALVGSGVDHAVGLTTSDMTATGAATSGNYFLPGLAAHYAAMAATPTVAVDGVKLEDLLSVEDLYNHLMTKFTSIREASDIYKGYAAAAEAYEKARMAKADWAAAEVSGLTSEAAATWAAKRDAAGSAYTAAADLETKRLGLLLSAAGAGLSTAYDTLAEIKTALTADLATVYVTEDVLDSLHRRAVDLKNSTATYNRSRAAVGTDAEITSNATSRDTAIVAAVQDGASNGAYEFALTLVNTAYQGIAGFSANAGFGTFASERLTAITHASRKVMMSWLADLTATIAMATTGTDAADHRTALQIMLQGGVAVNAGSDLAGRIFSVGALFNGAQYTATHSALRGVALSYDMVLKSLVALSTTDVNLDAHQGFVADALTKNATAAKAIAVTAYAAGAVSTVQMTEVITQLTQRADIAEAVMAAAYGALRSNTASETSATYKAARAQAITAVTSLIQEGGMELAVIVLNEVNAISTADLKAKAAHQLARLLMAKAASERIRFDNLGAAADKVNALKWYLEAVNAYKKELSSILSQTDSSLMENRNTRLIAVYANLAEAYKQAIENGADAALIKEQYTATFNQAQIIYREGNRDLAAKMLESLKGIDAAKIVKGTVLRELAEEYEADGKFLKSAQLYKDAAGNHVLNNAAAEAYEAAENALKAAQQSGHPEACQAAAEAFTFIGEKVTFHGRVRAEAYAKAAEAYVLGEMKEEAAVAYNAAGSLWAKIGDHMQAGNQHEKAAWVLSKAPSLTVDLRIEIIQAVEKAAHQLQIADASTRLEKLVELAEMQIAEIKAVEDSIVAGKLKVAVIAAAGAMYEKALAFQKEGDISHAEAAEVRILELLKLVDSQGKEAAILAHVANLYSLQKKDALAVSTYIDAAKSFVEGVALLKAAAAYASAADAALVARQGTRIKDEILPALLEISTSVRSGGDNAGRADQFDIHLSVVEVYRDLATLNPSEIDAALAEVTAIEAEAPTQKIMQARIAGVKIELLSLKAKTLKADEKKLALLQQAQTVFDAIKELTGETTEDTVKVKKFVATAANSLVKMYELTRVIHTDNGLVYVDALRAVIDTAEAAAVAAFDAASKIKMSYDVALEASTEASKAIVSYTKAMLHYTVAAKDKGRADDVVYLRGMSGRMVKIVENAVRSTLLGILKSREEAAVIRSNFAQVMNASSKVNRFIVSLRKNEASHDSHGKAAKVATLKAKMAITAATIKGASGDLADQAAVAHTKAPVARAAATDVLVAEKTEAVVNAVSAGVSAQAELVKDAPAASVSNDEIVDHAEAVMKAVIGDGKAIGGNTNGLVGELQKAQTGPSTGAAVVINTRG